PESYVRMRVFKLFFAVFINYALISLFYLFLRKTFITIVFSQFLFFLLSFINIKKEQYLSASLTPSDFLLIKETFIAAPFLLKSVVLIGITVFVIFTIYLYRKENSETRWLMIPNAILSVAILSFFISANFTNNFGQYCDSNKTALVCQYRTSLPNTRGDWVGDHLSIKHLGYTTFFFSKSVDSLNNKVFKSQNIPEDKIQAIFPENETQQNKAHPDELPNIIFIMSESHWDATKLDKSLPKNVTPNINRDQVSTLLSPSFGGGTANVEFEVLTSLNVFLNHNELLYVSKLKRPTYSLPMYLNTLGYDTTAMHNNGKYFYNRSSVYQNMGFNRFTSIENMTTAADRGKFINQAGWTNDDLIYDSIRQQLQNADQPQFIYAITVENHPMYNDDRFGANNFKIKKDVSNSSKRALNTFLSGMKRADEHYSALLKDISKMKRPTIVIFFGDHLPNLQKVYDDFGFYKSEQEKTEKKDVKFFETPLAVWSNFPIDKNQFKGTFVPAHFLAPKILEAAHIPLPPYYQFIEKVNSCYSTIHQTGVQVNKKCDLNKDELLNQYKDLNMDAINGKNFSYQILHQHS
ncbi:LTA synthase family protein, partial [Acinetobacter stercoris]